MALILDSQLLRVVIAHGIDEGYAAQLLGHLRLSRYPELTRGRWGKMLRPYADTHQLPDGAALTTAAPLKDSGEERASHQHCQGLSQVSAQRILNTNQTLEIDAAQFRWISVDRGHADIECRNGLTSGVE